MFFPEFGLNTERYSVSLGIQTNRGEIRTRKTPNKDFFYAVLFVCGVERHTQSLNQSTSLIFKTFVKQRLILHLKKESSSCNDTI